MRGPPEPDFNADPWIKENSPLSPDKLHAIGVIAFRWNQCEFGLLHLLSDIVGLPHVELWASDDITRLNDRIWLLGALIEDGGIAPLPASLKILPLPELLSKPPQPIPKERQPPPRSSPG
jgi:hypothetical protein